MNVGPPARGKFLIPTVATCAHRRPSADPQRAHCGLLGEISGAVDADLSLVHVDACEACCASFPPTALSWNPVIASLLHQYAGDIAARGGVDGCPAERAAALCARAEAALERAETRLDGLRPARPEVTCCYLGPALADGAPGAPRDCGHPAHGSTTLEQCRLCRDWSPQRPLSRYLEPDEMVPPPAVRSGDAVRRWSVGVVTAPRQEPTLEWCLDSAARAGWPTPHLFIDGLIRIPDRYLHLPVTWRESPVGAWPNSYLALVEMLQRDPRADAYLLLQDDAVLYDRVNLRAYLESVLWPGDRPGIVSLFCSEAYNRTQPGWHHLDEPWVWGAQAFVFSRDAALAFVSDPAVLAHRWTGIRDGRVQVDVCVGQWATARQCPVWFTNPSLAQHVGNTSSIWDDARIAGLRKADWFAGDLEAPFAAGAHLADFPEHLFPCRAEHRDEYHRRVGQGRRRMAECQIVVAGLCRSVRHFLPRFAARVEHLCGAFRDYAVVLFENDSQDATLEFLHDWQRRNPHIHVLSESLGHQRFPQVRAEARAVRMAEYRNRYRRYALEHFATFDHVLVTDTDLAGGWSYDGLAHTFGHDDWDFVGSNGVVRSPAQHDLGWLQFDAWAFRAWGHPEPHSNAEVNRLVFDRGEPMLPVFSCFGGMGVYRMAAFEAAEYGGPDLEHATLHAALRRLGYNRLFLNPSQIALYSPA